MFNFLKSDAHVSRPKKARYSDCSISLLFSELMSFIFKHVFYLYNPDSFIVTFFFSFNVFFFFSKSGLVITWREFVLSSSYYFYSLFRLDHRIIFSSFFSFLTFFYFACFGRTQNKSLLFIFGRIRGVIYSEIWLLKPADSWRFTFSKLIKFVRWFFLLLDCALCFNYFCSIIVSPVSPGLYISLFTLFLDKWTS